MAIISNENILKINSVQEILDFLASNMYSEENKHILKDNSINEYIKNVINIIDFETNYEMEGLWTTYNNYNRDLNHFIKSFKNSGNFEIANLLDKILKLYKLHFKQINANESFDQEKYLNEIEMDLRKIIDEKEYWYKVIEYIEKNKK